MPKEGINYEEIGTLHRFLLQLVKTISVGSQSDKAPAVFVEDG